MPKRITKTARELTPKDTFLMAGIRMTVMSVETRPYNSFVTVHAKNIKNPTFGVSAVVHGTTPFRIVNQTK